MACRTSFPPAIPFISPAMFRIVWKRYCRHACSIRLARHGTITWRSTKKFATARCRSSIGTTGVQTCSRTEVPILSRRYYFLASIKICQRFMLSSFRIPCADQGSFFNFSLTSFSSSALKIKREPPSSTKGPPIKMEPSATSRSINSACSSQKGCSRVPFDKSRFGPAEEITTNVFFIIGELQTSAQPVQPYPD